MGQRLSVCSRGLRWEPPLYPLWLIVLAYGGHMEQGTYPWGDFAHFVEYTGAVMSLFSSSLTVSFAWAATVAETLFGILLIAGFKTRLASVLSGLLLLSFAMGMATGLGIKTPFDYSVFSAAAAAFLLAYWEPDRFTLDKLLNRSQN
jgi:uncharacterized membrane protein YphA (DoxX/SURF4 family)